MGFERVAAASVPSRRTARAELEAQFFRFFINGVVMRLYGVLTFAFLLGACAGCAGAGSGRSAGSGGDALPAAVQRQSTGSTSGSTIYVSVAGNPASIVGFPASSSGNVAPTVTIAGSNTMLNNANAFGIAHDAAGNLYVVTTTNQSSGETVLEFAHGASGNVKPIRSFQTALIPGYPAPFTGTTIAVDGDGYVYLGGSFPGINDAVVVYPPGTTGSVKPPKILYPPSGPSLAAPFYLAVDAHNDLYVLGSMTSTPDVDEYASAASGNAFLRESPHVLERNSGLPQGIAISPTSGDVFASGVFGFSDKGAIYSGNASMTKLLATITGAATGLFSYDYDGLAFDTDGTLYALLSDGLGATEIEAFAPNAAGNVAPLRTIAGPLTTFPGDNRTGITVVPTL
jgi:hypothetical protein